MTKARIAEWILSQVLPPDRAASTLGDWIEDIDKRGNVWFWSSVIQTTFSSVRADLTDHLASTARIGFLGFARSILILIAISLLSTTVLRFHSWQLALTFYLLQTWWYFQTGRWIARRSPGHELAGCIAVSLIGWALIFARLPWLHGVPAHYAILGILPPAIAHDLTFTAGALLLRRRQLHPVG